MRILQVAPYFPPYMGGQERYVYYLSHELVRKGHKVTVITSDVPRISRYEQIGGIQVIRHTCIARPLRNAITPGLAIPWSYLREFDIIHTHNEHSFASNASLLLKNTLHKPLIITCHGRLVFDSRVADAIRRLYWHTVGKAVLRIADGIIVATSSEKKRLVSSLGINEANINIVPVGVDLDMWDLYETDSVEGFLRAYDLSTRKIVLVATQLIKRKGIQHLIQAMPGIITECPDVICAIAGTGDYEGKLRSLVDELCLHNHVLFLGVLEGRDLALAYKSSDVFVLPSLSEGQPTCIMEAWAFSKPVVATRIEGVVDYYDRAASLVEVGDHKDLATAIVRVLGDPSYAKALGTEGRRLVESTFRWDRITDCIVRVYEHILTEQSETST
ncbi:MAG: hypothetical protein DRJ03_09955 [Chloroflexi bacterium]|nr:MAG: hypothetical protein DRI81_03300 [Chloroflexota bacterium]RLC86025.1 MAG: hypothetical protein DRJ03_09955 [Chloroflexota bacterium]